MGRGRKKKLLIITILLVAVTSLSIGLATFSNVLTISSRATVKPGEGEYKVTIYGFTGDLSSMYDINSYEELLKYFSLTESVPGVGRILISSGSSYTTASTAVIDNETLTIKNVSATFAGSFDANVLEAVSYLFFIKNEGAHEVFVTLSNFDDIVSGEIPNVCIATTPAKQSLVDEYCSQFMAIPSFGSVEFSEDSGMLVTQVDDNFYKLLPGEYVGLTLIIGAGIKGEKIAETGEFSIEFADSSVEFNATNIYAS